MTIYFIPPIYNKLDNNEIYRNTFSQINSNHIISYQESSSSSSSSSVLLIIIPAIIFFIILSENKK